jgi:hypothetical protein
MAQTQNTLPDALRSARIIWACLLFAQFLYIPVGRQLFQNAAPTRPDQSFTISIAAAAFAALALALFFRIKLVRRAGESLRTNPNDAAAIARWRKGQLVTMIFAETPSLYGLVLLTTGAPLNQVALFYVAGIAALLFFYPKNPANT